jgi:CRISPR-associated protein Cas6
MYWQEETNEEQTVIPGDVVDLLFQLDCRTLPVDHAWALHEGVSRVLPWFASEPMAGLHLIHGADSGNGWERPQASGDLLYLSRRTRLILRLPDHRLEQAGSLSGNRLEIAGNRMDIGRAKPRPLSLTTILYSRYVVAEGEQGEDEFITWAVEQLRGLGLRFKKVLCGKQSAFHMPKGPITTRSLMVADLPYEDALELQKQGIGPMRQMGFGLFIPQKSF